jgi:multidrug efflux pump
MLRKIASQVAEVMRQDPELSNVNFDWNELSKAVEIEIDQDKARLLGVSSQDLAALLNMSLNGYTVTSFREGEKTIDVVLRGDRAGARSPVGAARPCRTDAQRQERAAQPDRPPQAHF